MQVFYKAPGLLVREVGAASSYFALRPVERNGSCVILVPTDGKGTERASFGKSDVLVLARTDAIEVHLESEQLKARGIDPAIHLVPGLRALDLTEADQKFREPAERSLAKARIVAARINELP